jgi:aryl-alcohol dehydrogenase-like predicted oxidoreductase
MEFRRLGTTDVEVGTPCLGTMTWGGDPNPSA